MNRRRNIIRFGQEDQSDMADSVDAAEDRDSRADTYGESVRSDSGHYDLTEDMAYADPAFEAEEPRRAAAWQGLIGRVLGSGLPVVDQGVAGIAAGYENFVALPIHSKGEVSHIVAWYS